ncbi:helix-turn-helix transcriptional regulator [Ruminococcus sp.]|uniref:helix-turn-helix transcriptional regulator n=1 Tax=Ruminococcus sp. TaxID=41978 RepID=UPI002E76F43C|nr:WYL domain-containing protein [Ruminococcus sp.]MEE1263304.1 WYL domain-containing protein [Ruminococcus sp.]
MPKSANQKQKLLYLQKILLEKTDDSHALTIGELKDELARYDIQADRKTLYSDLELLEGFGLDVCSVRSSTVRYYVGNRDFQLAELKLLVDAIQSSKFITRKKSLELIDKLSHLVSENDAKQLRRQVFVTNRVKNVNEKIYYNVDILHNAIAADRQISFTYFKYEVDFSSPQRIKKVPRKNEPYVVSPLALCWDDENYYLVAFDGAAGIIKHYRVDKMEGISTLSKKREGGKTLESFNPAQYAKSVFSMFGGEEADVKLSVNNDMIGVIVDRFGTDIIISPESDDTFTVNLRLILSPQFYAWLFGMENKIRIVSPEYAKIVFSDKILAVTSGY